MPGESPKLVACPACGKLAPYAPQNKWRPFCSDRCKLIDLGHWAAERYRLPDAGGAPLGDEPHED